MLSSEMTIAAGDVKPGDIVWLPEIASDVLILIQPHRKAGHTEIIHNGRPYIYSDDRQLLTTKPISHEL